MRTYQVVAHNAATDSSNRIHDDGVARAHGFAGGLVPGVTVYAYMTRPVVEAFGRPWLKRGTMRARFLAPFFEGQRVTVTAAEAEGEGLVLEAVNDDGDVCAVGSASLVAEDDLRVPDLSEWPRDPLSHSPLAAERAALERSSGLGSVEAGFHADRAHGFLGQLDDDLSLYADEGIAHPGYLLRAANDVLAANVALGPWIHTASEVTNLGVVGDGDRVSTRARVARLWERKGHELVELDVVSAVGDRAVLRVRHEAIYRLRPPA